MILCNLYRHLRRSTCQWFSISLEVLPRRQGKIVPNLKLVLESVTPCNGSDITLKLKFHGQDRASSNSVEERNLTQEYRHNS